MNNMYRLMQDGEEQQVIELIKRVFDKYVAPSYPEEGVTEFYKYVNIDALRKRYEKKDNFVLVCISNKKIIGVIEMRNANHIAVFFVDSDKQKKGIGRILLRKAVKRCLLLKPNIKNITVNSAPEAVLVYSKLGFVACGSEQQVNGIKYIPMELTI